MPVAASTPAKLLVSNVPIRIGNSPTNPFNPGTAAEPSAARIRKKARMRQPVPQAADGVDVARVIPLVNHPHAGERAPVVSPWLTIWIDEPSRAVAFSAKIPSTMNPMWLTELYATSRLMSVCASAASAP